MAIKPVQAGQKIWVSYAGGWGLRPAEDIEEWIVVRVNGSSFYAHPVDDCNPIEYRFSRKSWVAKDSFGGRYTAYDNSTEFYDHKKAQVKRRELRKEIEDNIARLSVEKLERIAVAVRKELNPPKPIKEKLRVDFAPFTHICNEPQSAFNGLRCSVEGDLYNPSYNGENTVIIRYENGETAQRKARRFHSAHIKLKKELPTDEE